MRNYSLSTLFSVVLVMAGLSLFGGKVYAGEVSSCSLGSGTLAFGNYQPSSGNRTTVGSVQMSCTCRGLSTTTVSGSSFITLSDSSSNANRVLQNLASTITYGVYSDANYSNVYPSVAGSALFSFTGNCPVGLGNSQKPLSFSTPPTFTLYGRILDVGNNLNTSAGLYSGTLTLTISY